MIRLDKTTRKLQVVLGGAVTTSQLVTHVSYFDHVPYSGGQTFTTRPADYYAVTNDTTDVDICPAPSVNGSVRNIDYLRIYNRDTVASTVTVKVDDSGSESIEWKVSLDPNESLFYEHGRGWYIV